MAFKDLDKELARQVNNVLAEVTTAVKQVEEGLLTSGELAIHIIGCSQRLRELQVWYYDDINYKGWDDPKLYVLTDDCDGM